MVVALIGKEVRNVLEGEVKECLGKVEINLYLKLGSTNMFGIVKITLYL
jgi:hypothetical protein